MIIGGDKKAVIENMKQAAVDGDFNRKVEVDDPKLTQEQETEYVKNYIDIHPSIGYRFCNTLARGIADTATKIINRNTEIDGVEKLRMTPGGAIVTSNHFNPIDNTAVRYTVKKAGCKRLFIVSQATNLAMTGWIGFLMNYTDIIPIMKAKNYMEKAFPERIANVLDAGHKILIYPEEEMWFNYRKPRIPKRGAYYFAAKNNVPVVSLFVEIRDLQERDNDQFMKVRYIVHVLDPIMPDPSKSVRQNSIDMAEIDFRQKIEAYEKAYGRKYSPSFEDGDVAGWIGGEPEERAAGATDEAAVTGSEKPEAGIGEPLFEMLDPHEKVGAE
ncbi:MAG: lysophospholipid acyltransferase family protein [Anaerovoracaceae bacterium]|jgi:1-acyl-sn-glycerol-3-phosphate acyltransferase